MDSAGARATWHGHHLLAHSQWQHRLHAAHRRPAEPHQQIRHTGLLGRWQTIRHLEPHTAEKRRQPRQDGHARGVRRAVALLGKGAGRHRRRTLLQPCRHRLLCPRTSILQGRTVRQERRRRRINHHTAAGQADIQPRTIVHARTTAAESQRVGHRCKTGALLHQGGNHSHVLQLLRFPLRSRGHQGRCRHLFL